MTPRVSPTERLRAEIDELFAGPGDLAEVLEQVTTLSVRLMLQAALEAEVTEFLGRDRYARGDREREGYRGGYTEVTIRSTAGPIVLERPKLRGTAEASCSRLLGLSVTRSGALEALIISSFVRGLSVRDARGHPGGGPGAGGRDLQVHRGKDLPPDRGGVRRLAVPRPLGDRARRALPGRHPLPLPRRRQGPAGALRLGPHLGGEARAGGLDGTSSGSTDAWRGFLQGLVDRGLRPPLLVVSDGAPGLIDAVEICLSKALRQRCLVHRARNLIAKVPKRSPTFACRRRTG